MNKLEKIEAEILQKTEAFINKKNLITTLID